MATRTCISNDKRLIHDLQMRNENPLSIFINPKPDTCMKYFYFPHQLPGCHIVGNHILVSTVAIR
jgi:hypothetical protein